MEITLQIKILPAESESHETILAHCAEQTGYPLSSVSGYQIQKRSLDARGRQIWVIMNLTVFIDEAPAPLHILPLTPRDVSGSDKRVVVIGAGPAGLFAALKLVESGIQPIVLERGKDVRARRKDLALLNREGEVNPESNYCFGEGGAGTYSDGKLYTRSNKRGDLKRILHTFVRFGAAENILYDAHPHIGTNKLPQIITAIRQFLLDCGARFLFEKKVVDWKIEQGRIRQTITADGDVFEADAVILATGHSARDIFQLLAQKEILLEAKPFAIGVRIEHPQDLIDRIQYGRLRQANLDEATGDNCLLPPASYSLVQQINGKGVFSFCMCPGGIIAPASTSPGELVVNGWSPSKRNNPFGNSGIVVTVDEKDLAALGFSGPLGGMRLQQQVEQHAFRAGGGKMVAPAQCMTDFVENKLSSSLPPCSYLPGIRSTSLQEVLPAFIYQDLREAFRLFGKKMRGYYTQEAVVVATESRTSSPVRIPRDPVGLNHPQLQNLFPCGEGPGYAGGIVSAAMDGERVAQTVAEILV